MANPRPLASLSLDLDDLWCYLRAHGDPGWEQRPSYLARLVPRLLDQLEAAGVGITFFLVGSDAARPEQRPLLRAIADRGHEVANHSFEHEPWPHRFSPERLEREIALAEEALELATGQRTVGFRGPGFTWSPELFEVLHRRQYLYDASLLPTFWGPVFRAYYFAGARLTREQRRERRHLFGSFRDGLRPQRPYCWSLADGERLLEIPVTTFPLVRTPFHASYLAYLMQASERAAIAYLETALLTCRWTGVSPSFLFHSLDLVGLDDAPALHFFPAMAMPIERKQALFRRILHCFTQEFRVVDLRTHAKLALETGALRVVPARSAPGAPTGALPQRS